MHKDGEVQMVHTLAQQGSPTVGLSDEDGKVRARLGLAADGSPVMRMLDTEGEVRALIGISDDGSAVLRVPRRARQAGVDRAGGLTSRGLRTERRPPRLPT